MAVQGPDLYVPRGTDWNRTFNILAGNDPGVITGWPMTANLSDNWQPIGNTLATASTTTGGGNGQITFPSDPGPTFLRPFNVSFTRTQLLLPNSQAITAFQQQYGLGAVLPNVTYYLSVWRTDVNWNLFWCKFIITPSTY